MDSDEECFAISGPKHISEIDWGKEEHRRCVTACLVKGTYVLESDRTKGRQDTPGARAPAWWTSFHLCLHKQLQCDFLCGCLFCERFEASRSFIYGAIFEHALPEHACCHRSAPPPRFIVAFRGTKLRVPTGFHDVRDNISIIRNTQDTCRRFRMAREHVAELLPSHGGRATGSRSDVVWLAGHSLGASVALDVGRDLMLRRELSLPTFLFNPPHVSLAPIASTLRVKEVPRRHLLLAKCLLKGAAARTVMRPHEERMEDLFRKLGPWVPELYVHKNDKICQGYIHHFEQQEKMLEECPRILQPLAKLGTKHSFRDMVRSVRRHTQGQSGNDDDTEEEQRVQPHLLPSARLWKNSTEDSGLRLPHKLKHWWKPDGELKLSLKRYRHIREA